MARPTTFPAEWRPLLDVAGSVRELAGLVGLRSSTSLWRMAHGRTVPGLAVVELLRQFCQKHHLVMPKEFKK